MKNEKFNTKAWRKYTGRYREVMRQSEWFRASLEHHCRESGRGTQADLSRAVDYKYQSMISNLLAGIRTADFRQCIKIAYYFGEDIISFIEIGRKLLEHERTPTQGRSVDRKLSRGRHKAD